MDSLIITRPQDATSSALSHVPDSLVVLARSLAPPLCLVASLSRLLYAPCTHGVSQSFVHLWPTRRWLPTVAFPPFFFRSLHKGVGDILQPVW